MTAQQKRRREAEREREILAEKQRLYAIEQEQLAAKVEEENNALREAIPTFHIDAVCGLYTADMEAVPVSRVERTVHEMVSSIHAICKTGNYSITVERE